MIARTVLFAGMASVLMASGGRAQTVAVDVQPVFANDPVSRYAGSSGNQVVFTVTNTGTLDTQYSRTCSVSGNVTSVSCTVLGGVLIPGQSKTVTATFTVGAAGTGAVIINVTSTNPTGASGTGQWTITIINSPPSPSVTPDNGSTANIVPGSTQTSVFTVTNTSTTSSGVFDFTAACRGTAVPRGCTITPTSATIAAGGNTTVNVQWKAGGAGTAGRIVLNATWQGDVKFTDDGSYNVSTQAPTAPATTAITTVGENPGTSLARHLCLTVGLSRGMAAECGDLRVGHLLPIVRTINKVRTPALLYTSATAHPYPAVLVTLTRGTGTTAFDSVEGILRINGTQRRRASWTGASLPAGTARQLVLSYDALADTTGIYSYAVDVRGFIGGVAQPTMTQSGQLVVVNRSASLYGTGWWVAGVERLIVQPDSSRLWIGGDGSTRRFAKVNATTFVAEGIEFPDTLLYAATPSPRFTRKLPGGTKVRFDNSGFHVATVTRVNDSTVISYVGSGATTRVNTIAIPPAGSGLTYTFAYLAGSNRLDSIAAPQVTGPGGTRSRGVKATLFADGRLQTLRDPDNNTVTFGYDPTVTRLLTSRTDKRATATTVVYDSARKVSQSTIVMQTVPNVVYGLRHRETQGLNLATSQATLIDTAVAYTRLDGPRTDVSDTTVVWLDRFGAPRRIRNALSHHAVIERTDVRFLGLPTGTMALNGFWRRGAYDARGNLAQDTLFNPYGTGANPVTAYTWHQTWDAPTQITRPLGDGITMTYDAANGNRLTQQDGRGAATQVVFRYGVTGKPGLVSSIQYPTTRGTEIDRDSLTYDGTLQNLDELRTVTVTGATTVTTRRKFTNDNAGQTTLACVDIVVGGAQQCTRTVYDILSRDSVVVDSAGATVVNPMQRLQVTRLYDPEGNRLSLARVSSPDIAGTPIGTITTQWGYDRAHRPVLELSPDGFRDSTFFGPASTVDSLKTRRGDRIRLTYNVLNQLVTKALPTVTYPSETFNLAGQAPNSPAYPSKKLDGVNNTAIGADNLQFTYDSLGNIATANNTYAQVSRTYWPGGALRVETQRVATYAGDFTAHVYPVGYRYDLNGRLETLRAPSWLTNTPSGVRDSVRFSYLAGLGALQSIREPLGTSITLGYDNRAQLNTITLPGGIAESFVYDGPGRATQDTIANTSTSPQKYLFSTLRKTTIGYDGRDKMTRIANTRGAKDTLRVDYSGLGQVEKTAYADHGTNVYDGALAFTSTDFFKYDAMGNVDTSQTNTTGAAGDAWERWSGGRKTRYFAAVGRVESVIPPAGTGQTDSLAYDLAGNQHVLGYKGAAFPSPATNRVSYFDAEQRLRAADYRVYQSGGPVLKNIVTTFEEYRYDALGRRVLTRTRRACNASSADQIDCGLHVVRRTVWSGNQELMEIQMPGHDSVSVATLENDTVVVRHEKVYGGSTGIAWIVDPNPYYGRVMYTPGLLIDQPLAVTRWELQDSIQATAQFERYSPFTFLPHWNLRGMADMGTFTDGGASVCGLSSIPGRCATVAWPFGWTVYQQRTYGKPLVWHGTVIDQKRDGSALMFRRNRYLDASTGRFGQEDPIGLAGGVNLYGYANGDPVRYRDPLGLAADTLDVIGTDLQTYLTTESDSDPQLAAQLDTLSRSSKRFRLVSSSVLPPSHAYRQTRFAGVAFQLRPRFGIDLDLELAEWDYDGLNGLAVINLGTNMGRKNCVKHEIGHLVGIAVEGKLSGHFPLNPPTTRGISCP